MMPRSQLPTLPLRPLVVLPSWVGDAAMATPALAHLRSSLKGSFIGGLMRPGIDQVLDGTNLLDEVHTFIPHGIMAPKNAAAKIRPRQYDTALLLTNSFSTALITRLAGIPRRIGFDKDARGLLLTHPLDEPKNPAIHSARTPTPAVDWYWALASQTLHLDQRPAPRPTSLPPLPDNHFITLATTPQDEADADAILIRAGLTPTTPFAILNPGGNNPAKRWPADRFAALAHHLATTHNLAVLINGSPSEADICASIAAQSPAISLATLGNRLGTLKALIRRAKLLVTNDTGPRYFALAFDTPCLALYGPTDTRWTTSPVRSPIRHRILKSNPNLPPHQVADDFPDLCRIENIPLESVSTNCTELLKT